jgi:hypothetical protein
LGIFSSKIKNIDKLCLKKKTLIQINFLLSLHFAVVYIKAKSRVFINIENYTPKIQRVALNAYFAKSETLKSRLQI